MVIYGVYIVSKSGGLIFNHENHFQKVENEKTFSFPLDIRLKYENKKIIVEFGQRDGIHGTVYSFNCFKFYNYILFYSGTYSSCC